jgi:hypothetical protein
MTAPADDAASSRSSAHFAFVSVACGRPNAAARIRPRSAAAPRQQNVHRTTTAYGKSRTRRHATTVALSLASSTASAVAVSPCAARNIFNGTHIAAAAAACRAQGSARIARSAQSSPRAACVHGAASPCASGRRRPLPDRSISHPAMVAPVTDNPAQLGFTAPAPGGGPVCVGRPRKRRLPRGRCGPPSRLPRRTGRPPSRAEMMTADSYPRASSSLRRRSASKTMSAATAGSSKSTTRWLVGFLKAPKAPANR